MDFAEIYTEQHRRNMFNVCMRILANREDAEDATQDAMIKAFNCIGDFRGECTLSSWLYIIARTSALMMLRKRQDTLSLDSAHEGERAWAEKLPGVTSSPEEQIILLEVTRQLETLEISSLNIMLLKVAGMKDKEIATATNSTVAAVKTRIFRARRQIEATFA